MKRILMICNYFAPRNEIASVRITKFAKYLSEAGYEVEVLTEHPGTDVKDSLLLNSVKDISVHHVVNGRGYQIVEWFYNRLIKPYSDKKYANLSDPRRYYIDKETGRKEFVPFAVAYPFLGLLDYIRFVSRQKSLYHGAKRFLRDSGKKYDVCFSSYGDHFSHYCGLYLKRHHPDILWIADFRDAVFQKKFGSPLTERSARGFENRVYQNCDKITVVTQGILQLIPEQYRYKASLLTNGFDLEDRRTAASTPPKFSFCYTGRMYGGMRKLDRLFEAVAELADEGRIDRDDVEFHYAGTGYEVFEQQAASAGMSGQCVDHGYVSHQESLAIQTGVRFLVVSSWEYKIQPIDMMPAKFYEYMTVGKPIVVLSDGDMVSEGLTNVIRQGNLGFAYNECCYETDFKALKAYLLKEYERYKNGEPAEYSPGKDVLSRFDYRNLSKQLIALIED